MSKQVGANSDRTKAAIMKAAEAVFRESGPAGGSLTEVSRRAGVTKSLVLHYFGTKTKLWEAVKSAKLEDYFHGQEDLLGSTQQRSPANLLAASIDLFGARLFGDPTLARLSLWRALENSTSLTEAPEASSRTGVQFADLLRRSQEIGAFCQDVDPDALLVVLMCAVEYGAVALKEVAKRVDRTDLSSDLYLKTLKLIVQRAFGDLQR